VLIFGPIMPIKRQWQEFKNWLVRTTNIGNLVQLSKRMKALVKRHHCTIPQLILPVIVQIPLFILVALSLRSMSGWGGWFDIGMSVPTDPLFYTEGFGAIKDLTQPDGSYILPVTIGLMSITNIEVYSIF
jgi:membrane protein insertase Oxa1/YidC/SpoIIIJ